MSESITNLADAVAALGALPMPVGPTPRTLDQVEDELTGVSLSLYEEELETARLRLALASAKRRALRRLPHEREGLIFHLERENKRLHSFVRVANEAALVSHRGWEQYSGEAAGLREENARLRARVAELEALTPAATQTCRVCGAGHSYGQPCSTCVFKARTAAEVAAQALREDPHDGPLTHSYRVPRDLPEPGGA